MNDVNTATTQAPGADRPLTFAEKMLALYGRFAYVQKTGKNTHFKYRFFQESVMKRKLNEACRELGLVLREVAVEPIGECTGKAAVVRVRVVVGDVNGGSVNIVSLEGIGGGMDSGDKAPMKAQVAAFKYALACGLSVETGDDPEADASTDETAAEQLLSSIGLAGDRGALESLRSEVAGMKGHDRFNELKAAFQKRSGELQKA